MINFQKMIPSGIEIYLSNFGSKIVRKKIWSALRKGVGEVKVKVNFYLFPRAQNTLECRYADRIVRSRNTFVFFESVKFNVSLDC